MVALWNGAADRSVQLLGLEEEDRVGVTDRAQEKALGIIGEGRADDLDPRGLRELRLDRVRMELWGAASTAEGRPDRDLAWNRPRERKR